MTLRARPSSSHWQSKTQYSRKQAEVGEEARVLDRSLHERLDELSDAFRLNFASIPNDPEESISRPCFLSPLPHHALPWSVQ